MADRDVFDVFADSYSEQVDKSLGKFGASQDFFTRHKAWLIGHLLERAGFDSKTMSLLDVGCGIGNIHGLLREKFHALSGVDVSSESLRVAAHTFVDVDYQNYDGQQLPYENDSFDMAMAICVFHHVPPAQWQGVAQEMIRVVRDGGLILVIEHNPYNPVTRYIVNNCPIDDDAVLLSPSQLRALFDVPGAQDALTRSILNVPPATRLLRSIDQLLGGLRLGAQYYLTATKCS